MASIYTYADSNTRKTWFLITGFLVFVISIGWLFSYILQDNIILIFATIFSVATSFGSYWWSDKIVLSMARAAPVEHKDNPELYHIVENLLQKTGLKTLFLYHPQPLRTFSEILLFQYFKN